MQIDDKYSDVESVAFDVPQGSILGPVIFNLYASDLQSYVQCKCHQYADDTTMYQRTKVRPVSNVEFCMHRIQFTLDSTAIVKFDVCFKRRI